MPWITSTSKKKIYTPARKLTFEVTTHGAERTRFSSSQIKEDKCFGPSINSWIEGCFTAFSLKLALSPALSLSHTHTHTRTHTHPHTHE